METYTNSALSPPKGASTQDFTIFSAISSFVSALHSVFGEKFKPLQLYNRLISKTTLGDFDPIHKHINAFKGFLNVNASHILKGNLIDIPKGTRIIYSERVYIDIQQLIYMSNAEQRVVIGQHLLNLYALTHPKDQQALSALETQQQSPADNIEDIKNFASRLGLKSETKEGALIGNLLNKTLNSIGGAQDMPSALMGMLSSGLFSDMQKEIAGGTGQGLNPKVLIKEIQGFMTNLLGEMGKAEDGDEQQVPTETKVERNVVEITQLGDDTLPVESVD